MSIESFSLNLQTNKWWKRKWKFSQSITGRMIKYVFFFFYIFYSKNPQNYDIYLSDCVLTDTQIWQTTFVTQHVLIPISCLNTDAKVPVGVTPWHYENDGSCLSDLLSKRMVTERKHHCLIDFIHKDNWVRVRDKNFMVPGTAFIQHPMSHTINRHPHVSYDASQLASQSQRQVGSVIIWCCGMRMGSGTQPNTATSISSRDYFDGILSLYVHICKCSPDMLLLPDISTKLSSASHSNSIINNFSLHHVVCRSANCDKCGTNTEWKLKKQNKTKKQTS